VSNCEKESALRNASKALQRFSQHNDTDISLSNYPDNTKLDCPDKARRSHAKKGSM
jgi:hypothetical protein